MRTSMACLTTCNGRSNCAIRCLRVDSSFASELLTSNTAKLSLPKRAIKSDSGSACLSFVATVRITASPTSCPSTLLICVAEAMSSRATAAKESLPDASRRADAALINPTRLLSPVRLSKYASCSTSASRLRSVSTRRLKLLARPCNSPVSLPPTCAPTSPARINSVIAVRLRIGRAMAPASIELPSTQAATPTMLNVVKRSVNRLNGARALVTERCATTTARGGCRSSSANALAA